jgi:hypothetical protein
MVGFSAWPIGDWTLKGLEVSDWIEGFISSEAGASVWARGDWVPDEDEISTWQMVQLLVGVHVEDQGYPQDDSPVFLLRISD